MAHLGIHLIADFFQCDVSTINSVESVEKIMTESVKISGATIIEPFFHKFSPHGVSGIIVVAESHFAIHTWPEHNAAAVDIFSCGEFDYMAALYFIRDGLKSADSSLTKITRGIPESGGGNDAALHHTKIIL